MKIFVHFTNKSKYVKSLDTREQLIQVVDLIAGARIRNAAALKSDELTLSITSHDIVAADAHYHASCYKGYVKVLPSRDRNAKQTDHYHKEVNTSIILLYKYIRTFSKPRNIPLTDRSTKLVYL